MFFFHIFNGYFRSHLQLHAETCNLSKAGETRDSLAVPVRRLSWSISIHFVAIRSWNLRHSHKLHKHKLNTHIFGFKVIWSHRCWHH